MLNLSKKELSLLAASSMMAALESRVNGHTEQANTYHALGEKIQGELEAIKSSEELPVWRIAVDWEVCGIANVRAKTLEEAIELAEAIEWAEAEPFAD